MISRKDLCDDCRETYDGYDSYRGLRTIKIAQHGNPNFNVSPQQRDRETAKSQQQVILNICERKHQRKEE